MIKFLSAILAALLLAGSTAPLTSRAANVTWTFTIEDADTLSPYTGSATLQIRGITSAGQPYDSGNVSITGGSVSVSVPYGVTAGYNIRASGRRTVTSSSRITASQNQSFQASLGSVNYMSLGYTSPLTTVVAVSSYFGWRVFPYGTGYQNDLHQGLDMLQYEGAPVYSICNFDPERITCGDDPSMGNYVTTVSTNGVYTAAYMHLKNKVEASDITTYTQGTQLGQLGNTGASTGPHLHLGIKVYAVYVDPQLFIPVN